MSPERFGFRDALARDAADDAAGRLQQDRKQVDDTIEALRAEMDAALPDDVTVALKPWHDTDEGEGRRLVFEKGSVELKAFTLAIPVDAYPVTIRVGDEVLKAVSKDDLEAKLAEAATSLRVIAQAKSIEQM